MRFLPAARIVILDADRDHRAFICNSLGELGLLQILPAATLPEAREIADKQPADLCVGARSRRGKKGDCQPFSAGRNLDDLAIRRYVPRDDRGRD
jgi:hypothetical protein